jgi:hypothetical protein
MPAMRTVPGTLRPPPADQAYDASRRKRGGS